MLVLSRKKNEAIVIDDKITVVIVDIRGENVRVGVEAPKEVPVHRQEVFDRINAQAQAEGERRVLAVAHGTYNRILLCVALGIPVRDYRRRFIQDRTNLTVLRYERGDAPDEAQLVLANDVSHLRDPGEAPWG